MGNLKPPSPHPQIKDRKMACFGFCAASSLLWGGWGFAVPFYSVQDCSFMAASLLPCSLMCLYLTLSTGGVLGYLRTEWVVVGSETILRQTLLLANWGGPDVPKEWMGYIWMSYRLSFWLLTTLFVSSSSSLNAKDLKINIETFKFPPLVMIVIVVLLLFL